MPYVQAQPERCGGRGSEGCSGCKHACSCKGLCARKACVPAPAQGELSHTDQAQEGYRGYLLRRLVPAVAAFYAHVGADEDGALTGEVTVSEGMVRERLAQLTTADLEGRLADLFDSLLMVRGTRL